MFIIFGSPRSGTTLLSSTLNLNDQIVIPLETDFIIPTAFIIDRIKDSDIGKDLIYKLITSSERYKISIGEYLSNEEIKFCLDKSSYLLSDIISDLYQIIANKQNAKIAGDKSPNDLLFSRILIKNGLFDSDIKIIHIIRDIRDVIFSLKKLNWNPDMEQWFPRFWSTSNLYIHNYYKSRLDKYILIKYENLVTNPGYYLKKITDFLEVSFQDKMLDHTNRGLLLRNQEHHVNLALPFIASKVKNWETNLDPYSTEMCEKQANEALKEFEYL
jgi:hypothetical protein